MSRSPGHASVQPRGDVLDFQSDFLGLQTTCAYVVDSTVLCGDCNDGRGDNGSKERAEGGRARKCDDGVRRWYICKQHQRLYVLVARGLKSGGYQ